MSNVPSYIIKWVVRLWISVKRRGGASRGEKVGDAKESLASSALSVIYQLEPERLFHLGFFIAQGRKTPEASQRIPPVPGRWPRSELVCVGERSCLKWPKAVGRSTRR